MYRLGQWLSRLTDATTLIGGLALSFMMLHITADVLLRYLISTPIPGTITYVSHYYMIIATFVPLAYAEKLDAHISVEVVTERLPKTVQYHLANLLLPVCALVLGFMTVRTWDEAISKYNMSATLVEGATSIIIWPSYFMLPLGLGLMVLVLTYKFAVYVTGAKNGLKVSEEERELAETVAPDSNAAEVKTHE